MKSLKKKNGFMVIEVLVAVSIITVSILAATTIAQKSVYVARQSFHSTQAAFLLEEGAEAVRILRDNSWTNISGLTPGTSYYPTFAGSSWTLSVTPSTVGIFTRAVTIQNVNRDNSTDDISVVGVNDPGTKLVTVTVSWPEGGTTVTRTLSFYIMDIFTDS